MRWLDSGRTDKFIYQRIAWPSFRYVGDLDAVTSCSITKSAGTSLKVSASLGLCKHVDFGNDLVRIISRSTLNGETAEIVHATLFAAMPSRKAFYESSNGKADLYSTLLVLQSKRVRNTLTIPKGTNAIEWARATIASLGLQCTATPSSARLNVAKTYERDTTYLTIVNEMCDFANYGSADVNGYGGIVLAPYQNPASKVPARTITDGKDGIVAAEFDISCDYFDVPNVVALVCSNDSVTYKAAAEFRDRASPLSLANRYEVTFTENVDDIPSQAALDAKAKSRLQDKLSYVERCTVTHPYLPETVGDVWNVSYPRAGYAIRGSIYEQDISMIPGMKTKTVLRRFVDVG